MKRGDLERLETQIARMLEMLRDPRLVDSLKGAFSIQRDVVGEIERASRVLEKVRETF